MSEPTMHVIRGTYRDSPGGLTIEHGKLLIEKVEGGRFRDPVNGGTIRARRFKATKTTSGVNVTSSESIFNFDPHHGELERIGLPVTE
jgi:hypothetical protein